MDHHRALRILALQGAVRDRDRDPAAPPSADFQRRKIFRWYSETFATPLHLVDELPVEDVMQHYYEHNYLQMSEDDLQRELHDLTATPAEAAATAAQANMDALGTFETQREVEQDDTIEAAYARAKGLKPPAKPSDVKGAGPAKAPAVKMAAPSQRKGAETELPDAVGDLSKKIEMTFVSLAELERLEESDGLGGFEPLTGLDEP